MYIFGIILILGIGVAAVSYFGSSKASVRMYGDATFNFFANPLPLFESKVQITGTYYMTEWETTPVHVVFYNSTDEACASCHLHIAATSIYVQDETDSTTMVLPGPGMYEVHLSSDRSEYIDVSISQSGTPGLMVGGVLVLIGFAGMYCIHRQSSAPQYSQSKDYMKFTQ